jgi:hypothetical protein
MPRPTPLPPTLPPSFSYAGAIEVGVTPRRLRASDLEHPFRGVRSAAPISDTVALASTYAARMLEGQYFSHLTAAQLLGLRMPEGFYLTALHVTSVAPARAPRCRGVVGHQSEAVRTVERHGLRMSGPVETWIASSAFLSVDNLVVMADGLVSRKAPVTTIAELADAVDAHTGRRGHARLAKALPQVRALTDSARETLLRLSLARAGYPEPEVNGAIVNRHGAVIAHGDLVFREYRTVLEYDGGQHRDDERQFDIDIERLDAIAQEGWRVIRVGKTLMHRPAVLLNRVSTALLAGGWRPPGA